MTYESKFRLKTNPFRLTPATNPSEIVWAGFPEIKRKFESRIEKAIRIPNSSLVLSWGEYGSGKTHAARFFSKKEVLSSIATSLKTEAPFSMVFSLPKGKDPVYNVFSLVVDKLNVNEIRAIAKRKSIDLKNVIENYTDNLHYQNVLKAIFSDLDEMKLKKYLYGNVTSRELKELEPYQILRSLETDGDYTRILAGLFTCLTHEKKMFSAIVIWIDEFEDVVSLSNASIDKLNNFVREILDNTANNLLIFINLTQSALFSEEDLGQYVFDSVRSRIKERITLDLPTKDDILLYIRELLNIHRSSNSVGPYFPFEETCIEFICAQLENTSLRRYNEAFSLLLELADMENVSPISEEFAQKHIVEIVGWKASK